jgi:hypothetical protein
LCVNNNNKAHAIQSTSDKSAQGQDSKSESVKTNMGSIKTALLEKEALKYQDKQSEKMIMIHRIASEDILIQNHEFNLIFYIK